MSTAKGQLYGSSLDLARRLHLFASTHPADRHGKVHRGPSDAGDGLDWKELLRKFAKHNPQREVTTQAARAEQVIQSLLAKSALAASYDPDQSHASDTPSTSPSLPPQVAWAPLILDADRSLVLIALDALDASLARGSGSEVDKNTAKIVKAAGLYAVGDFVGALAVLESVRKHIPDGKWEPYDLTLSVEANLIGGYACERLGDFDGAKSAYTQAGSVYDDACDILTKSGGTKDDRSLHKLGEAALFRAAFWLRSSPDQHVALAPHRLYLKYAPRWTPTFRPTKTHLVHRSLRSILHASGPSRAAPANWHAEIADNNRAEEAILRRTTSLPPAGEINKPYLRFLDDVAEGWRIGGAARQGATEVIDIMYNALSHTFQSQRLLRHLIAALTAKGSYSEAGQALTVYVELFEKARETDAAQVARDVRKFRKRANSAAAGEAPQLDPHAPPVDDPAADFDIDSDRAFVRTLAFGTRVFCKYLDDPETGLKLARRARAIFDERKDRVLAQDKAVESEIERALGVALGALTAKEADLETRPERHAQALNHLEAAASLDPSSWETLYHLSYQLAELRQISPALEKAREAVQLNATSRDCWHLLALLVGAQKDLAASLQVLETALDDAEECSSAAVTPDETGLPAPVNGAEVNGSVLAPVINGFGKGHTNGNGNGNGAPLAPAAKSMLPRDETEVLVSEVQIRMTKNVVIEAMEGPEAALADQQALLAFFSATYGDIRQQPGTPVKGEPLAAGTLPGASVKRSTSILSRRKSMRLSNGPVGDSLASPSLRVPSGTSIHTATPSVLTATARDQSNSASVVSLDEGGVQSTSSAGPSVETNPRATKLLVDLWLMTAASFRRSGRLEDARGAIQEAEALDADDPDVWVQFALINIANGAVEMARTSLIKALAFDLSHIGATVLLARLYLATSPAKLPYAEGMLDTLTKRQAWDVPEAWFELSRCYKGTARPAREKECLVWALQLEETKGVRPLSCLPRLL